MRTMAAFVIFSVVVACSLQEVFSINCFTVNLEDLRNCNDCIRCGGHWCNKPDDGIHCSSSKNDNWCPGQNNIEELPAIAEESVVGAVLSPSFHATTARVDQYSPRIPFSYKRNGSDNPNVHLTVINSTQTTNFQIVETKTKCDDSEKCVTHVAIKPETSFCLANSGKYEFLNVRVSVDNVTDDAVVKYHVPCACQCSDRVERNSEKCHGRGDFSCGVCSCHKGWSGDFCEKKLQCDNRRGDVQCTNPYKSHVECSGNGRCGECDTCICFDDREGSQYFEQNNYCADLGLTVTLECEICLHEVAEGKCPDCSATIQACNETLLAELDGAGRRVWARFEDSFDGAEYAAMRDHQQNIHIMRISPCNSVREAIAGGSINVTLPTVLGVVAVLAAASAVAGYMVWKARHAPLPLAGSQYTELDAPESSGMNPLYKPPTSSYNNPMWKGGAKV